MSQRSIPQRSVSHSWIPDDVTSIRQTTYTHSSAPPQRPYDGTYRGWGGGSANIGSAANIGSSGIGSANDSDAERFFSLLSNQFNRSAPDRSVANLSANNEGFETYDEICKTIGISNDDENARNIGGLFFGPENIAKIQESIVGETYVRSMNKFRIRKQRESSLLQIMKQVFLEYIQHEPSLLFEQQGRLCTCADQVGLLNDRVVGCVVPGIIVNCMAIIRSEKTYMAPPSAAAPTVFEKTRPERINRSSQYKPLSSDLDRLSVFLR